MRKIVVLFFILYNSIFLYAEDITFEAFYEKSIEIDWVGVGIDVALGDWNDLGKKVLFSVGKEVVLSVSKEVVKKVAFQVSKKVLLQYAINKYSYDTFTKESKNMQTMPLPQNNSGSKTYQQAIEVLQEIEENEKALSYLEKQKIIDKVLKILSPISNEEYEKAKETIENTGIIEAYKNPEPINNASLLIERYEDNKELTFDEESKKESLSALLYFISNNYNSSKKYAKKSIDLANKAQVKHTISSYIYATSSLYAETFNYDELFDKYLKYSFLEEPDNQLIPLLLSIHIERMIHRYSDRLINEKSLQKIFTIISYKSLEKFKVQNNLILLSAYINIIEQEKVRIFALTSTDNMTIKNSPKTLEVVKKSYKSYNDLLNGVDKVILALESIEVEEEAKKQVDISKKLIEQYNNDKTRLQGLIKELEDSQSNNKNIYILIGIGLFLLMSIGYFLSRRKEN